MFWRCHSAPPSLCTWLHYACIWLSAIPAGGKGAKRGRQEESGPWPLLHPHLKLQASPTPRARHLLSSKHPEAGSANNAPRMHAYGCIIYAYGFLQ